MDTCLQVQKAKLQKPFTKYASIPELFKPLASLNFSIPIKEGGDWFKSADIGFDIPIAGKEIRKWMPSVSAAIDGSFSVFWGIDFAGSIQGAGYNWKNQDARDIDEAAKRTAGFLATNLGFGAARATLNKAKQTRGGVTIAKEKGNIGMFFGLVGRVNYDEKSEKWVSRDLSSVVGLSFNYVYSKTKQVVYYVPMFAGVQVTASAIFGLSLGGTYMSRRE